MKKLTEYVLGRLMAGALVVAPIYLAALLAVSIFAQVKPTDEKVQCRNYKDVLALFDRLGYTQKSWQAGVREIPRVYLANVPETWHERSANLSVTEKKKLFFRLIAPIVLRINELILEDRGRANDLIERIDHGQSVTPGDQAWLTDLLVKYKVLKSTNEPVNSEVLAELLMRVDVVPPSLRWRRRPTRAVGEHRGSPPREMRCSGSGPGARA